MARINTGVGGGRSASSSESDSEESSNESSSSSGSSSSGGIFRSTVRKVEQTTGVDIPGEGSAIEQGKKAVEKGVQKVSSTAKDADRKVRNVTKNAKEKVREETNEAQEKIEDEVDRVSQVGEDVGNALTSSSQQRPSDLANQRSDSISPNKNDSPASADGQATVASGASNKSGVQGDRAGFGPEAEPDNVIESRVPEEGDILAGTSPRVRDFGRTVLGEEAPDTEITDSLTEGGDSIPFTLTDEEEAQARQGVRNYQDYFGVGEEAKQFTEDITGSNTAATFVGGLGSGVGDLASAPRAAPLLIDTGIETASNLPRTVQEKGAADTGEAIANTVFSSTRGGVEGFSRNPVEGAGRILGGFAVGAGITRGAGLARTGVRSRRVRARSDAGVDLADITSEKGVKGQNPTFETDTDAPTNQATDEVKERAKENPDAAVPGSGDSAIFHTTDSDISGSRGVLNRISRAKRRVTPGERGPDIDVGEGRSELPGLFGSPDASPLGLDFGSGSTFSVGALARPRLPGRRSDQVVSLPGDDVRGMPESATGAGYELRKPDGSVIDRGLGRGQAKSRASGTDLEVRPDSSTPGYEFLTDAAESGAFYVRPGGSRTPELEAISPPGSKFIEEGTTAVNMPGRSISLPRGREIGIPGTGRTIPMRRFRRADDSSGDGSGTSAGSSNAADADTETTDVYDLPSSRGRGVTPSQEAAGGGYLGSGLTTVSGSGGNTGGSESLFGASDGSTSPPSGSGGPTSTSDPFGTTTGGPTGSSGGGASGPTGGSGSGSSGIFSGSPTTPPGSSIGSPPSSPPGTPPSGAPSSPPSSGLFLPPTSPPPNTPVREFDLDLDERSGRNNKKGKFKQRQYEFELPTLFDVSGIGD